MSNRQRVVISPDLCGQRFDQALSQIFKDYSRSRLQKWLKHGHILLDGQKTEAKHKVKGGEEITLTIQKDPETFSKPEAIALDIIFEDAHLLVINKPVGLVVHPGAGNSCGTLVNALLHHDIRLEQLPRAGLVHRLDKETSGLLLVAKTLPAYTKLIAMMQNRDIHREYQAIVCGLLTAGFSINKPITRHPKNRIKMAIAPQGMGKDAVTHVRVLQRFAAHSLLRVILETGRTHQIRVHLSDKGYPLVGDPVYGGRLHMPAGASESLIAALRQFKHQALHAYQLSLRHPITNHELTWQAPLPQDMQNLIDVLSVSNCN